MLKKIEDLQLRETAALLENPEMFGFYFLRQGIRNKKMRKDKDFQE